MRSDAAENWAPDACTLPPADLLGRSRDFGELFTETVREIERPEPTRLRLHLEPGPQVAARAAGLAAAETACCSFFTFTLTAAAGSLMLDVAVPVAQVSVLDVLAERAATSVSLSPLAPAPPGVR